MRLGCLLWLRFAALDPVVEIKIADGAEGQVVIVGSADDSADLLIECMERVQMGGGCGYFQSLRLQKFLIAAVDQGGNFTADDVAGSGHERDASFRRPPQLSSATMFADFNLICDPGDVLDIKLLGPEKGKSAIEGFGWEVRFLRHRGIALRLSEMIRNKRHGAIWDCGDAPDNATLSV